MPKNYNPAPPAVQSGFLRPEIIAKVSRLGFTKKRISEGTVSGRHASPFRGYSSEFSAFRPYTQGDDIRYLDWKVFGRCERFYIRQFEQETNMRVCIVFDKSASMDFSSSGESKLDFAKVLASTLAYIVAKRGDSLGLAEISSVMESYFPDSRSMKNISRIISEISAIESSGGTDIVTSLNTLGSRLKRKTLVILISDMLTRTGEVIKTVKNFIRQKHNVIIYQVLDPVEFTLPRGDRFMFIDKETLERTAIDVKKASAIYRRQFGNFVSGIENSLKNCSAGYFMLNTAIDAADVIPEALQRTGFSFS